MRLSIIIFLTAVSAVSDYSFDAVDATAVDAPPTAPPPQHVHYENQQPAELYGDNIDASISQSTPPQPGYASPKPDYALPAIAPAPAYVLPVLTPTPAAILPVILPALAPTPYQKPGYGLPTPTCTAEIKPVVVSATTTACATTTIDAAAKQLYNGYPASAVLNSSPTTLPGYTNGTRSGAGSGMSSTGTQQSATSKATAIGMSIIAIASVAFVILV